MVEEHREQVEKFLKKNGDATLKFAIRYYFNPYPDDINKSEWIERLKDLRKNCKKLSHKELVLEIIDLSEVFGTGYAKIIGKKQCDAGKRRSCTDIFRIIKNYRDDITIFDVMHTLHGLVHGHDYGIWTSWCSTILQRTFRNEDAVAMIYNEDKLDEFGLKLSNWRDI